MGRKLIVLLGLLLVFSCSRNSDFELTEGESGASRGNQPERTVKEDSRHVLIMVSAGFNSLSGYMTEDLATLEKSALPRKGRALDQLVVLSRFPEQGGFYLNPQPPVLYGIYNDHEGRVIRDTIKVWASTDQICDTLVFREALELVQEYYPSMSYGMVFSSHASGWLPDGYYYDPAKYEREHGGSDITDSDGDIFYAPRRFGAIEEDFPPIPDFPAVKSIGQDATSSSNGLEMDLAPFCRAIPMRLDYLLFDACLNGCVEVAYELRGKADVVGFSQTEVLADGFNYETLVPYLLHANPDPLSVCRDYFEQYDQKTGAYRSATISLVNTQKMEELAGVCRSLFQKYRTRLSTMSDSGVQRYFRLNRHYFYDLKDILVHAGITDEEIASLDHALAACVLYEAHTPSFLGSFDIKNACGFSMYLPSMGTQLLDSFYKRNLAWNHDTKLIK